MCFYYCYSHECSFLYGKLYLNGGTASGLTCAIFGLIGIVRHEQSCTFLLQLAVLHLILNVMMWTALQGASTVVTSSLVQMSKTALRCWQFQFRVCYVQKFITGNSHC